MEVPGRLTKVLVVDDKPEGAYMLETLLRGHGYQTVVAHNGVEALECLRERPFDLVISDILMPDMDGYQFCQTMRRDDELKAIPFVFYSATYKEPRDEDLALKVGGTAFLRKPEQPHIILSTVARVLNQPTPPPKAPDGQEQEVLKLYNERLVKKLESKMLQLEVEVQERKRAEEERHMLEQQMLQAQKLETLGLLANMVAHDFNNLLLGIVMNADFVLQSAGNSSPIRKNAEDILAISKQAADLCHQLLSYSGKRKMKRDPIDLAASLTEFVRLIRVSIPENVSLTCNLTSGLPPIVADEKQMGQIALNLIQNAADAIGEKAGAVALTTGTRHVTEDELNACMGQEHARPGQYVYMEVEDSGCGMTPEILRHLCDPFFSTKDQGRGLGMASVIGIIRAHAGALNIQTEPGHGTRMTVMFPAAEDAVHRENVAATAHDAWRGTGTVMVVDDDETVRRLGVRILERFGFHALGAGTGEEALEILEGLNELAAMVLDIRMPGMGGAATYQALRQKGYAFPVLFISGMMLSEELQELILDQNVGFLDKPFQAKDLVDRLREMIEEEA